MLWCEGVLILAWLGPGGYNAPRGSGSQFQADDGMDGLDGSNQGDVSSDTPGSKGVAGDGRVKKKKQKTRPYPGLSLSDGGTAADTAVKVVYTCHLCRTLGWAFELMECISLGCGVLREMSPGCG